jgi:type II secretory pathway component GspD/PulD (secretin)
MMIALNRFTLASLASACVAVASLAQAPAPAAETAAAASPREQTTLTQTLPAPTQGSKAASDNASAAPAKGEAADNKGGDGTLRLNFRGVALEQVLDYLSDAAGFIIVLDTEVRGKVDVWSNQPLNRDEAVELLNTVLGKNGYTALRNGRTLTIISRDDAKKKGDTPVRVSNDPTAIPKSEEVVTQIIPVRYINAVQLNRDLQTLVPSTASMAANEGGNAIIMTDTLTNIRRFTEIVHALDTSIASVSAVQVFQLKYADAKALSTVIRDLFSSTDTGNRSSGNQQNQNVFRGMRGGGFPGGGFPGGGFPGAAAAAGGGGSDAGSSGNSRVSTPKVVAVADERSNALVVSAPEAQMAVIKDLVEQVDTNVEDVTELRVFRLQHADPQEMAEVIAGLFPDPTSSSSQGGRGGQVRFGGGGFGGFGGAFGGGNRGTGAGTGASSERLLKQSKVVSVPDLRTSSIVVSASHELMEQIASMVERLDADPARKQKVFVYSVENSDPQAVEDILRGLFENQNSSRNRSTTRNNNRQTGNQLNNRATQTQNQGNRSNTGLGANTRGATGFGGQ